MAPTSNQVYSSGRGNPQGSSFLLSQDCIQKLKQCLLCSLAAELSTNNRRIWVFSLSVLLYEAHEHWLWIKAKPLISSSRQQKSKGVDNKLRLIERNKPYPHFSDISFQCLAGIHSICLDAEEFDSRGQFLPCYLGAERGSGQQQHTIPCMLSSCACNTHCNQNQLLSFFVRCSAQNHSWMVKKRP